MPEYTEVEAPAKAPGLFEVLRTDPKKVAEGIWIEHPETGDKLRARRWMCPEHARAYLQAVADYEAQNGKDSAQKPGAETRIEAVAMSTGLIVDWRIKRDPNRLYDAAAMASLIADPSLRDLRMWIVRETSERRGFRPDDASGN